MRSGADGASHGDPPQELDRSRDGDRPSAPERTSREFTPEELATGEIYYNYEKSKRSFPGEAPGISVFFRDPRGEVFHTYSCYTRGLDMLNVAYHYLDLVPKGRDEEGLAHPMAWVRHHDRYDV